MEAVPPAEGSTGSDTPSLVGQVAIVTGAASGIGRATCLELLRAGSRVVAVDRDGARLAELEAELAACRDELEAPGDTLALVLDVRREEDMAAMAERTVEQFGRIDVLVASAGVLHAEGAPARELVDLELREWNEIVDTNLRGVFLANRAVLATMVAQKQGQIINLSSTLGRRGRANDAAYCATKFGVIGLTESVQQEVSRHGVKVNVVLPDPVATPSSEADPEAGGSEALSAERVATVILTLLTLPADTILLEPVVARFQGRGRRKKKRAPRTE